MCYIPDSGAESRDTICGGMEFVEQHMCTSWKVLSILHPADGGFQPGIRDVDWAVEVGLMALWQQDGAYGGLEVQPTKLIRVQINSWNAARYHKWPRGPGGTVEPVHRVLSCLQREMLDISYTHIITVSFECSSWKMRSEMMTIKDLTSKETKYGYIQNEKHHKVAFKDL